MQIEILPENSPIHAGTAGRKRVLVFVSRYLPGYKSGGPVRAVANMVSNLSSRFDFFIVTRDRDATDTAPYPGIEPNQWHRVGDARVLYCSAINPAILQRAFRDVRPHAINLNSFQDKFTRIVMRLRRSGALHTTPIILAPRGEFSPGAMEIKRTKKAIYRQVTKLFGLHDHVQWQVSAPPEKEHILRAAPARRLDPASIHVVREISGAPNLSASHPPKKAGAVNFVFISRISEKKNLHFVLDLLAELSGDVTFNIFGPVADGDATYWERCKAYLGRVPANIRVDYRGPLDHTAVPEALHQHHFFVLPTRGENYCHAAVESFMNGTPVVLSDETPWINLEEAHAGFDIPLDDRKRWISALQRCIDLDQPAYDVFLKGVREFSRRFSIDEAVQQHVSMFEAVIAGN